jgi:hypothetical protein
MISGNRASAVACADSPSGAPCVPGRCFAKISGILATGNTKSTLPVMMAARGIPLYPASSGYCAITRPPFSFTLLSPRLPSAPVPERTTEMARVPHAVAIERNKKSKGSRAP